MKLMLSGRRTMRTFKTGVQLSAAQMVECALERTHDWHYDVVSIGFPGPVRNGCPSGDPPRVGAGWVGFDYEGAFGRPVRIINDAALQALAAYRGKCMLFLGLGTGFGSTLIADDILIPLELGWLRFDARRSLLQQLADNGPERLGLRRWRRDVAKTVGNLKAAFAVDDIVLGGGNAARLGNIPRDWRIRTNAQAIRGALRLWENADRIFAIPRGSIWEIHSSH